jgi:hypothetical protein
LYVYTTATRSEDTAKAGNVVRRHVKSRFAVTSKVRVPTRFFLRGKRFFLAVGACSLIKRADEREQKI